jgi:hypothetical protein
MARAIAPLLRQPGTETAVEAARMRVSYVERGRRMHEDFYAVLSYTRSPIVSIAEIWGPVLLYSFKAPAGRLDRVTPLLQASATSIRVNVKWIQAFLYVWTLWRDSNYQAIRAAGEISRIISQANDAALERYRSAAVRTREAYERSRNEFGEYIRGVETYEHPFEDREVQLPSDYSYAWVSTRGEYFLTNDPGLNPNVGSTATFVLLKRA